MAGSSGRRKGKSRPPKRGDNARKAQPPGPGKIRGLLFDCILTSLPIGAICAGLRMGTSYKINHVMLFLALELIALGIMLHVRGFNAKVLERLIVGAGLIKVTGLTLTFVLVALGVGLCIQAVQPPLLSTAMAFLSERLQHGVPKPLSLNETNPRPEGDDVPPGQYKGPRLPASQMEKPVVVHPTPLRRGYAEPPVIQVTATSDCPLRPDSVAGHLGKVRIYANTAIPQFPGDRLSPMFRKTSRELVLDVDTARIIDDMYPETPHGLYRLEFTLADDRSPVACETHIDFNYIYSEDFTSLGRALVFQQAGFSTMPEGGLEIQNYSTSGGYISARLNRAFDFTTDFFVLGCFSMECEDTNDPPGLDIAFLDERGVSRLSIVFVEGRFDTIAIKSRADKTSVEGISPRRRRAIVIPSMADCPVDNDFLILVTKQPRGHLCCVHVGMGAHEATRDSFVHHRLIETHVLDRSQTRVDLRLWKSGTVRLGYLMIGEIGPM